VLGNGSDELIQVITSAIARPGACVLAPDPTFVMYRIYAMQAHVRYASVPLHADFTLDVEALVAEIARQKPALVWLASPNNPTGRAIPAAAIERVLAAAPGLVVVDEAYADFAGTTLVPRVLEFPNLVVMRTLSKVGLAGARLGYAVAHPAWIGELDKVRSPYNVNALTQAVVPVVLGRRRDGRLRSPRSGPSAGACHRARGVPGFTVSPATPTSCSCASPTRRCCVEIARGGYPGQESAWRHR
jgi:histidinol-phosphate aminotransferase